MARDAGDGEAGVVATGLTRGQVAQELGVSVSAVRRMEGKALHPQLVDGTWLFSHEEVLSVRNIAKPARRAPARSEGELSAELFHPLDQGHVSVRG